MLCSRALSVCVAAMLAGCGGSQPPIGAPGAIPQSEEVHTKTYYFTGQQQDFRVPSKVKHVTITAIGAAGSKAGRGGLVKATILVISGESLAVFVGGTPNGYVGGFNGGGNGSNLNYNRGGGGGGASDVRQSGDTPGDRVVVAGGGGGLGGVGTCDSCILHGGRGGGGGNMIGDRGRDGKSGSIFVGGGGGGGNGGTQKHGGKGGVGGEAGEYNPPGAPGADGALGIGGNGECSYAFCYYSGGGAGGGGGYYGGGGGGSGGEGGGSGGAEGGAGGGGGGGSSFVESGATHVTMIRGSGVAPSQIVVSW